MCGWPPPRKKGIIILPGLIVHGNSYRILEPRSSCSTPGMTMTRYEAWLRARPSRRTGRRPRLRGVGSRYRLSASSSAGGESLVPGTEFAGSKVDGATAGGLLRHY